MIKDLFAHMYMTRQRAHDRIESLLTVHIEALRGNPDGKIVDALENAKADFHGMIDELYDELDAIAQQEEINEEVNATAEDGA